MSNPYQALNIPPAANERGGFEFLRCAIVEGELHLTLRPVFNEPKDWGRVFAEVAPGGARLRAAGSLRGARDADTHQRRVRGRDEKSAGRRKLGRAHQMTARN